MDVTSTSSGVVGTVFVVVSDTLNSGGKVSTGVAAMRVVVVQINGVSTVVVVGTGVARIVVYVVSALVT